MLFANLKATLKNEIKPSYVMFGSDIFLINKSIDLILEAAGVGQLNVTCMEETAAESDIMAVICNVSMFGGKNAVVIRGESESKVILDKGKAERVDCNPMTADLVVRLIMQNKQFSQNAAAFLAQCCDNNYARVDNEINKILNFYKDKPFIERTDIEEMITKTENYQIYEISNALLKKDLLRADKVLQNLLLSGIDEYAVFGNLVSSVRRLFYSLKSSLPDAQVAAFLKVQPFAVTASRRDGRHLSGRIGDIYAYALNLEYQIKSGKILAVRAVTLLMGMLAQ